MNFGIKDFFTDVTQFLKVKRALGVDIGTVALKAVELERLADGVALTNYGILEKKDYLDRPNEAVQTTSLRLDVKRTSALLKTLLREMKVQTDRAVASVPLFRVFIVPIELPAMPLKETQNAVLFQARQYIPVALNTTTLDWVKMEDFTNAQGQPFQHILLTAVPNDLIETYKAIFRGAGVHLAAVEIESYALVRTLYEGENAPALLIDLGAESTQFAVIEGRHVKQVGQSDYGGASLTQALARSLEISPWRAEELKKRRGLEGFGGETELSTSLAPFLDVIIQEASRVRGIFEQATGRTIEKVLLTGGGANLPGIREHVEEQMGIMVGGLRPFSKIQYPQGMEPLMKELSNTFALSTGLAMKLFYGSNGSSASS
ncbi:MAG: type IV pilus assembly protein PilM [Patescibacteria group bacterium]